MSVFKKYLLVLLCFLPVDASAHDGDGILHVEELHSYHIFRLKGLIFGVFGIASVIVASFFLYHYILKRTRLRRNRGAVFSERGSLLPITESEQPSILVRSFGPLRPLRTYVEENIFSSNSTTNSAPQTPFEANTGIYRAKYGDPWENL